MKRACVAASALALCLALPLTGCFAEDAVRGAADAASTAADAVSTLTETAEDAASAAGDLAQSATETADALASIDWGAENRLVLKDAASGETLTETGDQALIQSALSALSQQNSVASAPDAEPEYVCEVWQPVTKTVAGEASSGTGGSGETPGGTVEQQVLEVTTFSGSDVVKMRVPLIGISLHLSSPGTADALRQLAG